MAECLRCGHEMKKVDNDHLINPYMPEELDGNYSEYACPYCGTYCTVEGICEEEKESFPKYNKELNEKFIDSEHGYRGLCPECGNHIIWSGDFMRSEVLGDVEIKDENGKPILDEYGCDVDDSLVSYVLCPYCGSYIEIIEAKPSEIKRFPIYKELKERRREMAKHEFCSKNCKGYNDTGGLCFADGGCEKLHNYLKELDKEE